MLEHTKNPLINSKDWIELRFLIPIKNHNRVMAVLKSNGAVEVKETRPWREAFQEEIKKYGEPAIALRGARKRLGITQIELAMSTGIPKQHISEMENGKRVIEIKHAKVLAKILNCGYRLFL